MGIDLRLLPCEAWSEDVASGRVWGFSHTVINFGRVTSEIIKSYFEMVAPHCHEVPKDAYISSYAGARVPDGAARGETMYGTLRKTDAYGDSYKYVHAQNLIGWLEKWANWGPRGSSYDWRQTCLAYVSALHPETKIILDWH